MNTLPIVARDGEVLALSEQVSYLGEKYLKSLGSVAFNPDLMSALVSQKIDGSDEDSILLLPDRFHRGATQPSTAMISSIPALKATREESSSHSVQFGRLLLGFEDGVPHQEIVAVKDMPVEKAVREAVASRKLNNSHSGMTAYDSIGFYKTSSGRAALLTRFEPTTSLDNILWRESIKDIDPRVHNALSKGAISLAALHANGIAHGDAQPKNLAWDDHHNLPWAIDLEDAEYHRRNDDYFQDEAENDLLSFLIFQPRMRSEELVELVASKYYNHFTKMNKLQPPPVAQETIKRMHKKRARIPVRILSSD